jgi:hypothetical protein
MPIYKIQAGRIITVESSTWVGPSGTIWYDDVLGDLRIGDDVTPGGRLLQFSGSGGGETGSALQVSLITGSTVTSVVNNVSTLRFDTDSGFDLTNLGNGAVKVGMNSTFKFWEVDGQDTLIAQGLDTIKLTAGPGISLRTNITSDPKELTISAADRNITLYQDGPLSLTLGTVRWYAPTNVLFTKITARLAESADDIVSIKVNKNDAVASTINIPANTLKIVSTATISMIEDDYLTIDVVNVGNTFTGSGLSVEFTYNLA